MFDELRDLYQEMILDHGRNPQNFRYPQKVNRQAKGDNPLCGDKIVVYLYLDESGRVEDAAFLGKGCAICTASASMMTEIVKNKNESEISHVFEYFHDICTKEPPYAEKDSFVEPEVVEKLQVLSGVRAFPVRVKCATLPWHALMAALENRPQVTTE